MTTLNLINEYKPPWTVSYQHRLCREATRLHTNPIVYYIPICFVTSKSNSTTCSCKGSRRLLAVSFKTPINIVHGLGWVNVANWVDLYQRGLQLLTVPEPCKTWLFFPKQRKLQTCILRLGNPGTNKLVTTCQCFVTSQPYHSTPGVHDLPILRHTQLACLPNC